MRFTSTVALAFGLVVTGAAHANTPAQVSTFKNTQASSFISFGPSVECPDGSIGTANGFGFIEGSDFISHTPGTPKSAGSGGDISIFGYSDSCGTSIGFGEAGFSTGYTAPNPQLTSAALNASGAVQDFDTGASYPIAVDLVFTGNGPLSRDHGTTVTHDFFGATVVVSHGSSSNRNAGVTGTITINGAVPEVSYSSTVILGNTSGSTIVTQK